jgi:hypothetical protein
VRDTLHLLTLELAGRVRISRSQALHCNGHLHTSCANQPHSSNNAAGKVISPAIAYSPRSLLLTAWRGEIVLAPKRNSQRRPVKSEGVIGKMAREAKCVAIPLDLLAVACKTVEVVGREEQAAGNESTSCHVDHSVAGTCRTNRQINDTERQRLNFQ